jgi:phage tail sheath protein FI
VTSWNTYRALFGDLSSAYDLGFAVYHFFANGGNTVYVSRVVGASAAEATANFSGGFNNTTGTAFALKAANVGTWGNDLSVAISAGLVSTSTPTFNAVVSYGGSEVERWSELSLNPDDNRFITNVLNQYSSYIRAYNVASLAGASYSVSATTTALTGGDNGTALGTEIAATVDAATRTAWSTALSGFDSVNGQLLFNLVGKTDSAIINNAITYVEGRGNSFLIIDPSPSATDANFVSGVVSAYTASSYAAVYYPMLKMSNPAASGPSAVRDTYPGGALAGLFNRVDTERNVAKAPAGYSHEVRNAFGTVVSFTEAQIGTLYQDNINVLKAVQGAGVIVNGARTLRKTGVTKYVPARRSLNFIKAGLESLTQYAVFEPNNARLWSDISARVSNFLASFWAEGGLKGNSTSEAYYIVCNSTNNTAETVDNGEVHLEVGVALQTPAEFIVITVSQFTGGSQVQETL